MNEFHSESTKKCRFDSDLNELNIYMGTNFPMLQNVKNFEELDLLAIRKEKEPQFPVLPSKARDILTIQASTVASESVFFS